MTSVAIVDTAVANIASMQVAIERLGYVTELTSDPTVVADRELVILPGVGTFASGMKRLNETAISKSIIDRVHCNRPTLAVCLGMQLMFTASEESPGVAGLAIVPNVVTKFQSTLKSPQLGWNKIENNERDITRPSYFDSGYAYFANSFRIETPPDGWSYATTIYGQPFVSALWKGRILACQFHPELSGHWGLNLLSRWASGVESRQESNRRQVVSFKTEQTNADF